MKTCKEIKAATEAAFSTLFAQYREEISLARKTEFPIETEVSWKRGLTTHRGCVVGYAQGIDSYEEVIVENHNTKTRRAIKVYLLEKYDNETAVTPERGDDVRTQIGVAALSDIKKSSEEAAQSILSNTNHHFIMRAGEMASSENNGK